MRTDPIILMSFHRSGSTFLTRLLNTTANTLIWGEHGGFITALRNSATVANSRLFKSSLRTDIDDAKNDCESKFIPFMNGFTTADYERNLASMLAHTFSSNLPDGTNWGFKEIRYQSAEMIDFFFRLFPKARMLFNQRDPVDLCVASLRAPWVVERLNTGYNNYNYLKIQEVVYNVLLRIYTHRRLASYALERYPENVTITRYEDLAMDPYLELCRVNSLLLLDQPDEERVLATAANKVGRGDYDVSDDAPEIHTTKLRHMAEKLWPYVMGGPSSQPVGVAITHNWDFCVGIMPNDLYSFNPKLPVKR